MTERGDDPATASSTAIGTRQRLTISVSDFAWRLALPLRCAPTVGSFGPITATFGERSGARSAQADAYRVGGYAGWCGAGGENHRNSGLVAGVPLMKSTDFWASHPRSSGRRSRRATHACRCRWRPVQIARAADLGLDVLGVPGLHPGGALLLRLVVAVHVFANQGCPVSGGAEPDGQRVRPLVGAGVDVLNPPFGGEL